MGFLTQSIQVDVTTSGMPLRVTWQGRVYKVVAEPVRWFERRRWWEHPEPGEAGPGGGVIDHELWRLQVRLAPGEEVTTFDVSHRIGTSRWRMICVHAEHRASSRPGAPRLGAQRSSTHAARQHA